MTGDSWLVAMVADGVSASPLAEEGAEIAIRSCREYFSAFRFSPYLDEEEIQRILYDAFNYALRRIQDRNREGEHIPYARYTTLHLVLYGPRIGLHWGQAGDGAVYLFDRDGHWMQIGEPMKNSREENSPVTLQDGPESWQFGSLDPGELDGILMTTDGLAEALEQTLERKEQTREMLKLVTDIPEETENPEAAEEWYQRLFEDETTDEEKSEAEKRLLKITDDITVLLVRGLATEGISSDGEGQRISAMPEAEEKPRPRGKAAEAKNGLKKKAPQMLRFLSKLLGLERHPSEEEQHET